MFLKFVDIAAIFSLKYIRRFFLSSVRDGKLVSDVRLRLQYVVIGIKWNHRDCVIYRVHKDAMIVGM